MRNHTTRDAQKKRQVRTRPSRRITLSDLGGIERLDRRILPTVTASFSAAWGVLTVIGDSQNNAITVSRNAAGSLLVNGGAVTIPGTTRPSIANTALIQVFGLDGNDTIALDETNGALPKANLFGGAGNDSITGGSGNDLLFGEAGNDTLLGKGGVDLLFGGDGDDLLFGGVGDDQVFGEAGNDRMVWNPGEGTDVNEGGAGVDTVEVNGGNGAENFTITANGSRVRFDRVTPAPFSLDIGTTENLVVNANGGDDTVTAGNGLAPLIQLTINGGAGNDVLTGGDGNDIINGGDGNDVVNGGRGNDTALLGAGDDTFVWNPGDGSDTVEGQDGNDSLVFNGANIAERIDVSANGTRARLTRDVGAVAMDLNGIEGINLNTLGGADTINVNDTTGTDLKRFNLDLSAPIGSGTGDGSADTLILNGTDSGDAFGIAGAGTRFSVTGLPLDVSVNGSEGANDSLIVRTLGGSDSINATALQAGVVRLTADGGDGNDTVIGSPGADNLIGGTGNDLIDGGPGSDTVNLGDGNDTFRWDPGDGSDTVEGGAGSDTLRFNGSDVAENVDISANANRVRLTRDVGGVVMDLNGFEVFNVTLNGGADTTTVNDTTGTDLKQVNLQLAATTGSGAADTVIVNGTNSADRITAASSPSGVDVTGLAAAIHIAGSDGPSDRLVINGLAGDDNIDASALSADAIGLTLNGGDGNDVLIGGGGDDLVIGGRGSDTALLGAGDDTFVWNPGDGSDTVEGQDGNDSLVFNGANIAERIELAANGMRARLTRDVGAVVMDLNGVEGVDVNALGGADTLTVDDLTGTDVRQVNLDLSSTPGSGTGDGAADTVIVNGTSNNDVIIANGDASGVTVAGLAAQVNLKGAEADKDRLVVNALGGDDVVEASGLTAGSIGLVVDGGQGNDILLGGAGNDTLSGGDGDDILIGGPGQDFLDGGPGENTLLQD